MPAGMTVDRGESGVAVVVLEGEQEAYQSGRLAPELASLLQQGVAIVVDLSGATFVDSSTLGLLLSTQGEAQRLGSGFVLEMDESTATFARRIFQITGLGSLFTIHGTRPEAVAAARTGEAGVRPKTRAGVATLSP